MVKSENTYTKHKYVYNVLDYCDFILRVPFPDFVFYLVKRPQLLLCYNCICLSQTRRLIAVRIQCSVLAIVRQCFMLFCVSLMSIDEIRFSVNLA